MYEVACVRHRGRLLDACWRCEDASIDPLTPRTVSPRPTCIACEAALANAPAQVAPGAVLRLQRGLACLVHHLAVHAAPEAQLAHLARRLATVDRTVVGRERVLMHLQPELWREWLARPPGSGPMQDVAMTRAATAWDYGRLFGKVRSGRPDWR